MRAALTLLALLASTSVAGPAALLDRVVAQVDGEVILLSEVADAQRRDERPGQSARTTLNRMIDAKLLRQEAERRGYSAPEERIAQEVEDEIRALRAQFSEEETFQEWLAAQGTSLAVERRRLRDERAAQRLEQGLIDGRVGTPPSELPFSPSWHLSQILIACDQRADEAVVRAKYQEILALRRRVQEGEEFAAVARAESEDAHTAERGGVLGEMERDVLDPGIAEALEGLSEGDVTVPVRTERGWHLLRVNRLLTPRERWYKEAFLRERASLLEELHRRAHVEIHLATQPEG
jgi:parvulin-like peptidyl-prolyl isomerase